MKRKFTIVLALCLVLSPFAILIGAGLHQAYLNAKFPNRCFACTPDIDQ